MNSNSTARQQLDLLFAVDSIVSVAFGTISLLTPHGIFLKLGGTYNHDVHEVLRSVC